MGPLTGGGEKARQAAPVRVEKRRDPARVGSHGAKWGRAAQPAPLSFSLFPLCAILIFLRESKDPMNAEKYHKKRRVVGHTPHDNTMAPSSPSIRRSMPDGKKKTREHLSIEVSLPNPYSPRGLARGRGLLLPYDASSPSLEL